MMSWKPPRVAFETRHLVKALFDSTTAEAELMNVAARGDVEITASRALGTASVAHSEHGEGRRTTPLLR